MKDIKIAGLSLPLFIVVALVTIIAVVTGVLPQNMIGAIVVLVVFGELLNLIGNNLPIIKTYFGGGPILVIFGGAALVYYKLIDEQTVETVSTFMKNPGGFLDFYIAALITGSLLGMNRDLLIKASLRYLPTILAGVVVALGLAASVSPLVGSNPGQAMAYVGIPIMGGGMGAGAVPIADVFSETLKVPNKEILAKLVPAVALGNAMAIVSGGILKKLGQSHPEWTGKGQMMRKGNFEIKKDENYSPSIQDYMRGLVLALAFFSFGAILSNGVEKAIGLKLHTYAYMIISVAIVKALNILPEKYTKAANSWYKFVAGVFTSGLMLGIGLAYTSFADIISAFSLQYIVLCAVVVIGAIIGTWFMGHLMGFYPIEAAITAGLCMANMGGTGDVAVLTASDRLEIMPFAQISSRLGGALIILLASIIIPLFFG